PALHQVPPPERFEHRVQVPVARRPEVAQLLLDFLLDVVAGLRAGGEQSEDGELGAVGGWHGCVPWVESGARGSIGPTYIGPIYTSREKRRAPPGRRRGGGGARRVRCGEVGERLGRLLADDGAARPADRWDEGVAHATRRAGSVIDHDG